MQIIFLQRRVKLKYSVTSKAQKCYNCWNNFQRESKMRLSFNCQEVSSNNRLKSMQIIDNVKSQIMFNTFKISLKLAIKEDWQRHLLESRKPFSLSCSQAGHIPCFCRGSGVNFNNILWPFFLYKIVLHSFSVLTVRFCNLLCKRKSAQKLLVKC